MNAVAEPFADVVNQAKQVVYYSLIDGGVTIDRAKRSGKSIVKGSGFVVGGAGVEGIQLRTLGVDPSVPADNLVVAELVKYVARWIQQLPIGKDYIGGWVDDGTLYVDVVDFYDDVIEALNVARGRGEKAIYDLSRGEEITVRYPDNHNDPDLPGEVNDYPDEDDRLGYWN